MAISEARQREIDCKSDEMLLADITSVSALTAHVNPGNGESDSGIDFREVIKLQQVRSVLIATLAKRFGVDS